ncbi:unnamed protein product [Darwinula stevensoni]|uniref:Origin recognition complex subunit 3 n=1 Tax=Darwinula stevensoni TaxID=69355 RepID=A0A7R8X900_9CRUS|nr:unnamed protein product [Darwinula stevensoni]CAG0882073.1 unnamed protein product [Darwinula stevensoni]
MEESDERTESLAQGVFAFRQQADKNKGRKSISKRTSGGDRWFGCIPCATADFHLQQRLKNYKKIVEKIDCLTKRLEEEVHESLIKDVIPYDEVMQNVRDIKKGDKEKEEELGFLEEDEDDLRRKPAVNPSRMSHCTMTFLMSWYQRQFLESRPAPKRRKKHSSTPPVVVILEDLEGFQGGMLRDFISICSDYAGTFPFLLVVGVATTSSSLHALLPVDVAALLSIETFHTLSPPQYLNRFFEKVVFSPSLCFHLGGKPLRFLVDTFLYHDFAISRFINGFKYCVLEHMYNEPHAVLCCEESDVDGIVDALKDKDLGVFRHLPSFQAYLKTKPTEKRQSFLGSHTDFRMFLKRLMSSVGLHHLALSKASQCIYVLTRDLNKSPLGTQLREVYCLAIASNLLQTEEFKEAEKQLRTLPLDELSEKLKMCQQILNFPAVEEFPALKNLLVKLDEWLKHLADLKISGENFQVTSPLIPGPVIKLKKMSRFELQEKLKDMAKAQWKTENPYEEIRACILDEMLSLLGDVLTSVHSIPLNEVVYFHDLSRVKPGLAGYPRAALHHALADPHSYLHCTCCPVSDKSSILSPMPDICIAYKLHLECGKMINLCDWMASFSSVLDSTDLSPAAIRFGWEIRWHSVSKPFKRHLWTKLHPRALSMSGLRAFDLAPSALTTIPMKVVQISVTPENIASMKRLIDKDRWITTRELEKLVGMSHGSVIKILHEHLGMRKVCARWVPHQLKPDHMKSHVDFCGFMLQKFNSGASEAVGKHPHR